MNSLTIIAGEQGDQTFFYMYGAPPQWINKRYHDVAQALRSEGMTTSVMRVAASRPARMAYSETDPEYGLVVDVKPTDFTDITTYGIFEMLAKGCQGGFTPLNLIRCIRI
jgi:hypothetical protein